MRTQGTSSWIASHVKSSRRCRPPRGSNLRPDHRKEEKGLASRYYPLLSGHASTGAYLAEKIHKVLLSECWRCGSGERQSRYRLFFRCRARRGGAGRGGVMWEDIGEACGPLPSDYSPRTGMGTTAK